MNTAFAWGWTWWHVFPIKTLIEYIFENKQIYNEFNHIFWIWEKNSLEEKICFNIKNEKLKFIPIYSGKLRREKTLKAFLLNILDLFKFFYWIIQSIFIIKKYNIDKIFCKWWYVALPIVIAGYFCRKDVFLHESDTVPWLVNKIASKFAKINFVWFPDVLKNSIHTWQIISNQIVNYEDIPLWFDLNKTNILVTWWSQGSRFIYNKLLNFLEENDSSNFNFFVVLWIKNLSFKSKFEKFSNVKTFDFLEQKQIWYLYSICDIWITRWSATLLAEQKLRNIKLIIIPLLWTWWNHQYYNWLFYQKTYDDLLIEQNNFKTFKNILFDYISYKKSIPQNIDINYSKETILKSLI